MKKFIRKSTTYLGITTLLLMNVSSVSASTSFSDVDNSYAKEAIQDLVEKGILEGLGEGKFNPTEKIARQDFAVIMAKALQLDLENTPSIPTYSDVPLDDISFKYVEATFKAGLFPNNDNPSFSPHDKLTREDMAVVFANALEADTTGYEKKLPFEDAKDISDYAKAAVGYAVKEELIIVDSNKFNPKASVERQEVALVASNFVVKAEELGIISPLAFQTEKIEIPIEPLKLPTLPVSKPVVKAPVVKTPVPVVNKPPTVEEPIVDVPPTVEEPVVDIPPVDIPSADVPPMEEEPIVDTPPVDEDPTTDVPPIGTPPVIIPPTDDEPVVDIPPVGCPPVIIPPTEEDPTTDVPPMDTPPMDFPPTDDESVVDIP